MRKFGFFLFGVLILSIVLLFGCDTEKVQNASPSPNATSTMDTTSVPMPSLYPSIYPSATGLVPTPTPTAVVNTTPPTIKPTATPDTDTGDQVLVRVADYLPEIQQNLIYATDTNFTGIRIYDFTEAYLRYGTVKKLAQVSAELEAQGLGLLIWDAYRPIEAQQLLWDICPDPTYVSNPTTGNRTHSRGGAVDLTLVDLKTGKLCEMPSGFDEFSPKGDREYSDVSAEAAANSILLEKVMKKYGFKPYSNEWWHYNDQDEYPVDEIFNPAIPIVWEANCNEYINLRKNPSYSSKSITKIYKGNTFILLEMYGKFAKVEYRGKTGYVMANYIKPSLKGLNNYIGTEKDALLGQLEFVELTNMYSYESMIIDIKAMGNKYSEIVTVESIGKSEEGRDIPVIILGNKDAEHKVLMQGAIHAREHMTAWLLMAMSEYWCANDILEYSNVCFHIIPMSNPDGVILSQTGNLNSTQVQIYKNDKKKGYTYMSQTNYAAMWKANALGVDINRNFPAGWDKVDGRSSPSSELYQGTAPFSSKEAAALRDYTYKYDFDVTVSYHATGSIIYYEYGKKQPVNSLSKSLAQEIKKVSGYGLATSNGVDGAGYKDWVIDELLIPSVTIEIGSGDTVLEEREIYSVFARNYRVMPTIVRWLETNK